MGRTFKIEALEAKTGHAVLKIDGYLLHSKYNPIKEAQKYAKEQYAMHHSHIIFGYGNGYIIDALSEQLAHGEKILIIDPMIEQGIIKIHERHKREPFYYWSSSEENTLGMYISGITSSKESKVKVICSYNYDKLFPKELRSTLHLIKDYQEKSIINENTTILFSKKWQKNLAENTISVINDYSLEKIHRKYSKPVIIASGGPSLTKQLPLLKRIKDNAILIAAGSTINSLLAANIEPDFVVSIDGGESNYHHFKELEIKNARLIYCAFNHPKIRHSFKKKAFAFVTSEENQTVDYFNRKFDRHFPKIIGGGTVAHFALSIAQYISSGPIAMIGQDLAYTNNKTHASNNKHERKITKQEIVSGGIMVADGYYGDRVSTSKVLYSMKTTFEEMAKLAPSKVPVYNCTEGGLKINGYNQIPFQEFCEKYVDVQNIQDNFSIEMLVNNEIDDHSLVDIFEDELIIYDKINSYLSEALLILKKNKSEVDFSKNSLKKLDKIDKKLMKLYPDVQMQFIVGPLVLESSQAFLENENETVIETYQRVYNQSKSLYKNLLEVTKESKENIESVIYQLKNKENYIK
ncbi:motility associated factor glycosyltransferase family protein [Viridibacillus sp. YIM B01967]|uniref:Motility associated factor glycosyltransferase family protein n=1 Tax=Viridibacillus soli TaxID=2798301 RepID=A0ABS1H612_9BACL|nr:6-hydroxymethylpterin diphosphokinase MptE-like protein [Viridibacillus soli]MBK3494831.1 motility associated factor glycosyltransferase family protein [Viridibacillus soli]